MAKVKFLALALITATSLAAAPALAAGSHVTSRHTTGSHTQGKSHVHKGARTNPLDAYASAAPAKHFVGACIRAPRVGAFATAPWNNGPPCEPNSAY
jgi:hypothetical protein